MSFSAQLQRYPVVMICLAFLLSTMGCGSGYADLPEEPEGASAPKTFAVKSYGAKGDGVSDDAPAVQRALTAAAAAGGGKVVFPCGEFAVLSAQGDAPAKRSALFLKGASGVQLLGKGRCTHLFTALPQTSLLEFAGSEHISVTQMRLTALNAKYVETYGMDGGSAIRFTGVTSGSITHVEVDGASAGALYLTAGSNHSKVANNQIHDTYGAGIWEDDCGGANAQNCSPSLPASNNVYDSNILTNTTLAALSAINIDDGNGVSNAIIQNNVVSWTRPPQPGNNQVQCIQVNNASGVNVLNNSCTGSPWNGIVVTTGVGGKAQNVTIRGNTIKSSGTSTIGGAGIVIYNAPAGLGVSGFVLSFNTISVAADDGISIFSDTQLGKVSNGQIVNNTISMVDQRSSGTRFGINIQFADSIAASSNSISCNGTCIAAGVNIYKTTGEAPQPTANTVSNILGPPLRVQ